jgi:hypothetical protein
MKRSLLILPWETGEAPREETLCHFVENSMMMPATVRWLLSKQDNGIVMMEEGREGKGWVMGKREREREGGS